MRILHIYRDCLGEGGVPHLARRLIEAQAALGHDLLVVSAPGGVYPTDSARPIAFVHVTSDPWSLRRLRARVAAFEPDVAHISGLTIASQQLWSGLVVRSGLPYVLSPHGVLNPLGMNVRFGAKPNARHRIAAKKLFRRLFDLPLLRAAAAIHAECEFEGELARRLGAKRVFTMPIGIDCEWTSAAVAGERKLGDPVTLLHLGRFDIPQKGLDLVLRGLRRLVDASSVSRCRVVLAGSSLGSSVEALRATVQELALDEFVEIREPVWEPSEKEALWREADFFLSVFRYGGMPRATAEALGNGLPTIASRESNWGDWVRSEKMGVVAGLTAESVASAMATAAGVEPSKFETMAANAYAFSQAHSWPKVAAATVDEYERIVRR